ncbi:MAG: response regulator transcription factor [Planctomycetota bacterium]
MAHAHILLIEDDPAIQIGLEGKLSREGYRVTCADDGRTALNLVERGGFDLVVLDLMLPEIGGLSLLASLRQHDTKTPVLIISALIEEREKINGLRSGADDYLAKPFGAGEFMARVEALLRRARGVARTLRLGKVEIDLESSQVRGPAGEIALSRKERELLLYLLRRPNQVLARDMLQRGAWGEEASDARAVDYHMLHLRRKLECDPAAPQHLVTRHGLGYEFVFPSTVAPDYTAKQ